MLNILQLKAKKMKVTEDSFALLMKRGARWLQGEAPVPSGRPRLRVPASASPPWVQALGP